MLRAITEVLGCRLALLWQQMAEKPVHRLVSRSAFACKQRLFYDIKRRSVLPESHCSCHR